MCIRWKARFGVIHAEDTGFRFEGGTHTADDGQTYPKFAIALCNRRLSNGNLRAKVTFHDSSQVATCALIVRDNAETGAMLIAGLGVGGNAYGLRIFDGRQWNDLRGLGDWKSIESQQAYDLDVRVQGTRLTMLVDEVVLLQQNMPSNIPSSQVGIWCQSHTPLSVSDFSVNSEQPRAFVIMQYSEPYNQLYADVIQPVCKSCGIVPFRADEESGPGFILADVIRRLIESSIIIAEITPQNQNVFYELGYAHAMNKPTVLVAERGKQLPFDVSGFRTLFYENTISGKSKIEAELRRHLEAIMSFTT